jgi:acyl-coenzyme A synthetase/AMP-(fatty) acid ligase
MTHFFVTSKASRPTSVALWFDNDLKQERKWTFSDLQRESIRSSIFLRNILNIPHTTVPKGPLDQPFIMTILGRIPEWWFLHLAAIRIGSIFSPGTTMLSAHDIQYRLETSRASLIVTDEDNLEKVDEAVHGMGGGSTVSKNLRKVVVPNKNSVFPKDWIKFEHDQIGDEEVLSFRNSNTRSDHFAQAYFTSGSTGMPKMVPHSHVSYGMGHSVTAK